MSMADDHIGKVSSAMCANGCRTVHEVSDEVGTCTSSCHMILKENLNIHHAAAKFVLRLLNDK